MVSLGTISVLLIPAALAVTFHPSLVWIKSSILTPIHPSIPFLTCNLYFCPLRMILPSLFFCTLISCSLMIQFKNLSINPPSFAIRSFNIFLSLSGIWSHVSLPQTPSEGYTPILDWYFDIALSVSELVPVLPSTAKFALSFKFKKFWIPFTKFLSWVCSEITFLTIFFKSDSLSLITLLPIINILK